MITEIPEMLKELNIEIKVQSLKHNTARLMLKQSRGDKK